MNKAQAKDSFAATVAASRNIKEAIVVAGKWLWAAHGPLAVADPVKLLVLTRKHGIILRPDESSLVRAGRMHVATWDRIRDAVRSRRSIFREIESLLSGGNLLWSDLGTNRLVNVGLDEILDKFFKGSTYTAAHYVGLTDGTPTTAAGDTMASHAGWAEVTAYSQGTRPSFTPGTVSGQSVDNSASKAQFSINGTTTVGGGFLSTDSTKGGASGILVSVEALSGGDKGLGSGDTLSMQATYSLADS